MAEIFPEEISAGASYSFYDNARYVTLSQNFWAGICADRLSVTSQSRRETGGARLSEGLGTLHFL